MNKIIQQVKQEMNKPSIDRLYTYGSKIYARYVDENQVFEVPMKTEELIQELQTAGTNIVNVMTDIIVYDIKTEEQAFKLLKRLNKIAEKAGYISGLRVISQHNQQGNIRKEWNEISGNLLRQVLI